MYSRKFNVISRAAAIVAASVVASIATPKTVLAVGPVNINNAGPVIQGTNNGQPFTKAAANNNAPVTISFAGQTALKNFFTSGSFTKLQPTTSIVLHNGVGGAGVTYGGSSAQNIQLASNNFGNADVFTNPATDATETNSAILATWKTEGSIDGYYDLINDQVGYYVPAGGNAGTYSLATAASRSPSSANPIYVNTNSFTAPGTSKGFTLASVSNLNNTYDAYNANGTNTTAGGTNRVQFSVGEYPTEALSYSGTASPFAKPGTAGYGRGNTSLQQASIPGAPSVLTSLGTRGARQQFQPQSVANEATNVINPSTGSQSTGTNYTAGPWNTAGANNIDSQSFAATAVTYSANPGTGLQRLSLGDTQWLQTSGRLQNGALFNVVARTVNTGQRTVFALNTGIDPTWAVGSNDNGDSTTTAQSIPQHSIGPSLRFDGKTSGSEAAVTIAQNRLAVGALSIPEATVAPTGTSFGVTANEPVRALDINFDQQTNVNPADDASGKFVRANFNTIVSANDPLDGTVDPNAGQPAYRYKSVLISHFNTVKAPNQTALNNELIAQGVNPATATPAQQQTAWAAVSAYNASSPSDNTTSGIQGDTTGDVAAVLSNTLKSDKVATFVGSPSSANDPADGLLSTGYLLPGLLDWNRVTDGGSITPQKLSTASLNEQSGVNGAYSQLFTSDGTNGDNSNTIYGASSPSFVQSYYGQQGQGSGGSTPTSGPVVFNGQIPITAKTWDGVHANTTAIDQTNGNLDTGGNYLFGNFNQNGVRDYAAVLQAVNAALSLAQVDGAVTGKNSAFTADGGLSNSTVITSLDNSGGTPGWVSTGTNTKGDLIVLGDFAGSGRFDGQSLYLLATGASLADSVGTGTGIARLSSNASLSATASTFSDVVRDPTKVLRKNDALDYIQNYLNTSSYTAAASFLKVSGKAVLSYNGATAPAGSTDLHTTDPITGAEQYTYDPSGNFSFNKSDITRTGTVDLNDAVLVDNYTGQSYTNLTQSLAATQQAPVANAANQQTIPLNLVNVQQIDGESAIGAGVDSAGRNDQQIVDAQLTGSGVTNFYAYNLQKTGSGTIVYARTGGTVNVYTGASVQVSGGRLQIGDGTNAVLDPFTDNNANVGNHVAITVDGTGKLVLAQHAGTVTISNLTLTGSGTADINDNGIVVQNTAGTGALYTKLQGYVSAAYDGGAWDTAGITSSAIQASIGGSHPYGIAVVDGNDPKNTAGVAANTVLVESALVGDIRLTGSVDFGDYQILLGNYGTGTTWSTGDFHNGGTTGFGDYQKLLQNYGAVNSLTAAQLASIEAFGASLGVIVTPNPDGFGFNVPNVPEPTSMSLVMGGLLTIAARRRRA